MSGGVDSAVAAARAVEAGHDVVGVHLALSRNPGTLRTGARGCCTIEDSMDARRAATLLGMHGPDLLAAVVRDADAPVVCETPGGAAEHIADFAWLRERL